MTDNGFNIFTELEKWSEELEPWQRCALSKLIKQKDISDDDIEKILNEFMLDKGLKETREGRTPYKLDTPASKDDESPRVILKKIKDVIGVNALAPDQILRTK